MRRSFAGTLGATGIVVILAVGTASAFVRSPEGARPERPSRPQSLDSLLQESLTESLAWQAFQVHYHRHWAVQWNEEDATPHRAYGAGIPLGPVSEATIEAVSRRFIDENRDLFQVSSEDLALVTALKRAGLLFVTFQRQHQGVPVDRAMTVLRFTEDGRLILFGADTHPLIDVPAQPAIAAPEAERIARRHVGFVPETDRLVGTDLRIFPREDETGRHYLLAYRVTVRTENPVAKWVVLVDARTGEIADAWDEIRYDTISGTATGDVQLELADEPFIERPFKSLRVDVSGSGFDYTDAAGFYTLEVSGSSPRTVSADLRGQFVDLNNVGGPEAFFSGTATPGIPFNFKWDISNSHPAERDVYFHATKVHDYVKDVDPSFTDMDYPLPANVNLNQTCNAYWDGVSINFFHEGGGCVNTGQIADVVYHEYGHGVTQFQYNNADPPGDMHEGFSDYLGVTITDQPLIGRGFFGPGTFIRNADNTRPYPDPSCGGEVHCLGEAIVGALWHMRGNLIISMGHNPGVALADSLWQFAKYGFPYSMNDFLTDLLTVDDDDGNIGNGTPHSCEIYEGFGRHGIGPGGDLITIGHDPLQDTGITLSPYPVVATVHACAGLQVSTVELFYSVSGGLYASVPMLPTGQPEEYSAEIPAQPSGSLIRYYIVTRNDEGRILQTDPPGAPGNFHSFEVLGPQFTAFHVVSNQIPPDGDMLIQITVGNPSDIPQEIDFWMTGWRSDIGTVLIPVRLLNTGANPVTATLAIGQSVSGTVRLHVPAWLPPPTNFLVSTILGDYPSSRLDERNFLLFVVVPGGLAGRKSGSFASAVADGGEAALARLDDPDDGLYATLEWGTGAAPGQETPGLLGGAGLPRAVALAPNFPNPFNPSTTLSFDIPEGTAMTPVHLRIYTLRGELVRDLRSGEFGPGRYQVHWDGRNGEGQAVSSGTYLYRLETGTFTATRKMIVAK